jgi:hypothetical protein
VTRRDYELIAAVLRDALYPTDAPAARAMHSRIALDLARKLGQTNPNFNRTKFINASTEN